MGRGLSDLQKAVLLMAHENSFTGDDAYSNWDGEGKYPPHVKRARILEEYFGWQPDTATGRPPRTGAFNRQDVGHKRYNAVMASLSRSLHRLETRGLIYLTHSARAGGWSGAELTEEGRAEALRLLANSAGKRKRVATNGTTRVVNIKSGEPFDLYIGNKFKRGRYDLEDSPWRNPHNWKYRKGLITAYESIGLFLHDLFMGRLEDPNQIAKLPEVQGKVLACWCKPGACHGDVIARLADRSG